MMIKEYKYSIKLLHTHMKQAYLKCVKLIKSTIKKTQKMNKYNINTNQKKNL